MGIELITMVREFSHTAVLVLLTCVFCAAFTPGRSALAQGENMIPAGFFGAWETGEKNPKAERLVIRRSNLILIRDGKTLHGNLIHREGDGYLFRVDFIDGRPANRAEKITLRLENGSLVVGRGGNVRRYTRMEPSGRFPTELRDGFSYNAPEGWVSNVRLFAKRAGADPESYDTDQLIHFYEAGVQKPTENMTLRLLNDPYEKVLADISRKISNPALASRKRDLVIGGRKGSVFENSTPLGSSKVTAKVYILPWTGGGTMVLAAPTLLPYFPFDLDRDCRSLLSSLEPRDQ